MWISVLSDKMANPVMLCICFVLNFVKGPGILGLNQFKETFFKELKPKGRRIMRPSHGLLFILGIFVIFGLPVDAVDGSDNTTTNGTAHGANNGTVDVGHLGSTNDTSSSLTTLATPPALSTVTPITTTITTTQTPTPSVSSTTATSTSMSANTTPATTNATTTVAPEIETITTQITFVGNLDIQELFKLLENVTGQMTIDSTSTTGDNKVIQIRQNLSAFTYHHPSVEVSANANQITGNKKRIITTALKFESTRIVETSTSPTTTRVTTSTTGMALRPSKRSGHSKMLLFLCLAMMVILALLIAYRCVRVGSASGNAGWEQFRGGCSRMRSHARSWSWWPEGRRTRSPVRNRLLPTGSGPEEHPDYPGIELYERL